MVKNPLDFKIHRHSKKLCVQLNSSQQWSARNCEVSVVLPHGADGPVRYCVARLGTHYLIGH